MKTYQQLLQQVQTRSDFTDIAARAPQPRSGAELQQQSDAYYLSNMCLRIFRAGLKHSVVDAKWPAFEQAFFGFEPEKLALLSDDQLEKHMQNTDLIRHWGKIKSIRANAIMVQRLSRQYGGFGNMLAEWPIDDITALWALFKKEGAQLGGKSGPYFLRMVGKDTFCLTGDVTTGLIAQGVISKAATSKADIKLVQNAFNCWHEQSGAPMCQISWYLAHSFSLDQ